MTVDPASALRSSHRGRDYFFCSPGCQETFDHSPDAYTGEAAGVSDP